MESGASPQFPVGLWCGWGANNPLSGTRQALPNSSPATVPAPAAPRCQHVGAVLHGDTQLLTSPPPQEPPWPGAAPLVPLCGGREGLTAPSPASWRGAGMLRVTPAHPTRVEEGLSLPPIPQPSPGVPCPFVPHSPPGRTHAGASFPWPLLQSPGCVMVAGTGGREEQGEPPTSPPAPHGCRGAAAPRQSPMGGGVPAGG